MSAESLTVQEVGEKASQFLLRYVHPDSSDLMKIESIRYLSLLALRGRAPARGDDFFTEEANEAGVDPLKIFQHHAINVGLLEKDGSANADVIEKLKTSLIRATKEAGKEIVRDGFEVAEEQIKREAAGQAIIDAFLEEYLSDSHMRNSAVHFLSLLALGQNTDTLEQFFSDMPEALKRFTAQAKTAGLLDSHGSVIEAKREALEFALPRQEDVIADGFASAKSAKKMADKNLKTTLKQYGQARAQQKITTKAEAFIKDYQAQGHEGAENIDRVNEAITYLALLSIKGSDQEFAKYGLTKAINNLRAQAQASELVDDTGHICGRDGHYLHNFMTENPVHHDAVLRIEERNKDEYLAEKAALEENIIGVLKDGNTEGLKKIWQTQMAPMGREFTDEHLWMAASSECAMAQENRYTARRKMVEIILEGGAPCLSETKTKITTADPELITPAEKMVFNTLLPKDLHIADSRIKPLPRISR